MGDAAGATSCSGRYACCSEKASEKSLCSRQRAVYVMVVVAPARQEPLLRSCRPRPQPTPAASLETQQHLPASNAPVRQCLHILVQSRHIQHQRKGSGNVFHVSCVQEQCAYFWYWRSRALWVAMLLFKVHFYNPDLLGSPFGACWQPAWSSWACLRVRHQGSLHPSRLGGRALCSAKIDLHPASGPRYVNYQKAGRWRSVLTCGRHGQLGGLLLVRVIHRGRRQLDVLARLRVHSAAI